MYATAARATLTSYPHKEAFLHRKTGASAASNVAQGAVPTKQFIIFYPASHLQLTIAHRAFQLCRICLP